MHAGKRTYWLWILKPFARNSLGTETSVYLDRDLGQRLPVLHFLIISANILREDLLDYVQICTNFFPIWLYKPKSPRPVEPFPNQPLLSLQHTLPPMGTGTSVKMENSPENEQYRTNRETKLCQDSHKDSCLQTQILVCQQIHRLLDILSCFNFIPVVTDNSQWQVCTSWSSNHLWPCIDRSHKPSRNCNH